MSKLKGKRILVLEPHPDFLRYLEHILREEEADVIALSSFDDLSGGEALKRVEIVLADYLSIEASLHALLEVPTIAMSTVRGAQKAALKAGFTSYIEKPFSALELVALVEAFTN